MKKVSGLIFIAVIVGMFAGMSFAATTGVGFIKIKILAGTIAIQVDPLFNTVSTSVIVGAEFRSAPSADRIVLKNTGVSSISYKLQLTACTTSWTAGSTSSDNGVDKYVLQAVFDDWTLTPNTTNFADNDIISTTALIASATYYAIDDSGASWLKGYSVPYNDDRNLRFRFLAPASITTSYNNEETITVTFTGVTP